VAAAVGKHHFAALLAEGVEARAVELQQRVALAIAQLVAADPAVVAIAIGGDAVEGEPGPPCASQDQRATSCAGAGLRRPSSSGSISGWSMGLMCIRSAMNARRRRKAAEGLVAMEGWPGKQFRPSRWLL
jgi:hypothetical protein